MFGTCGKEREWIRQQENEEDYRMTKKEGKTEKDVEGLY